MHHLSLARDPVYEECDPVYIRLDVKDYAR